MFVLGFSTVFFLECTAKNRMTFRKLQCPIGNARSNRKILPPNDLLLVSVLFVNPYLAEQFNDVRRECVLDHSTASAHSEYIALDTGPCERLSFNALPLPLKTTHSLGHSTGWWGRNM